MNSAGVADIVPFPKPRTAPVAIVNCGYCAWPIVGISTAHGLCLNCLDGNQCPDCGHLNCGRYWTDYLPPFAPCACHEAGSLLDRRLAHALAALGTPHSRPVGAPFPPLPVDTHRTRPES